MRWTIPTSNAARRIAAAPASPVASIALSIVVTIAATTGCHMVSNPYVDELSRQPPVSTPSVDGVRAMATTEDTSDLGAAISVADVADATPAADSTEPAETTHVVGGADAPGRAFSPVEARWASGSVSHGPLYFEDGYGEASDDDDVFAWSGDDWLHGMVWRARFLVNTALFPISVVVTPPCRLTYSDGRPSRCVFGAVFDAGG
jgi:hypothetical protein